MTNHIVGTANIDTLLLAQIGLQNSISLRRLVGEKLPALRWLDIRGNHLGDVAVIALLDSLARHSSLRSLVVRDVGMTSSSCHAIAQVLSTNKVRVNIYVCKFKCIEY